MKKHLKNNGLEIRPFPLWAMLICGIAIIAIGLYMLYTNDYAGGNLPASSSGGKTLIKGPIVISGISTVITGA